MCLRHIKVALRTARALRTIHNLHTSSRFYRADPKIVSSGTLTADRVVSVQRSTQGAGRTEKLIEIDDLATRTAHAGSENRGTGKRIGCHPIQHTPFFSFFIFKSVIVTDKIFKVFYCY